MTSRERVTAAFRHQCPDRTPIWEKLIKSPVADELLGRPWAPGNFHYRMERLADGDWEGLMLQEARDLVDLARELGFDLIRLSLNSLPPSELPVRVSETTWRQGRALLERLPSGWVRTTVPGAAVVPESEQEDQARQRLAEPPPPPPSGDNRHFLVLREARRLMAAEGLDLPIFTEVYRLGVATLPPYMLRWFVTDRDLLQEHYRRNRDSGLHLAHRLIDEGADLIGLGGDFACNHGPMCSPADYRELIAPQLRAQSAALHARGVWTSNASDGDLWPVLEDFLVTAGVDGFEEMDFAAGMDLARLKQAYPEKTYIGNIDIRHTLTSGTVAQVRQHTQQCLRDGWGRGGHILMSGNCIHENVKTELFVAHLAAYREFFGLRN